MATLRHDCRSAARCTPIIEVGRGDDRRSKIFDAVIITLILLNIAAFMAETVKSVHDQYGAMAVVRSKCSPSASSRSNIWRACGPPSRCRFWRSMSPWQARLRFARAAGLIIDLLAILPFYLSLLMPDRPARPARAAADPLLQAVALFAGHAHADPRARATSAVRCSARHCC